MKKLFLIILTNFILSSTLFSISFKEISTDNGLSNRHVFMSAKDNDGYIWFATRTGIDRYNGDKFVHYKLSDKNGTIYEHPRGIFCNYAGELYVFSEKSVYSYSAELDSFSRVCQIAIDETESIITIEFDSSGTLWVGTNTHLYYLTNDGQGLHSVKDKISIYSITFDSQNCGWIGTSNGILQLRGIESGNYSLQKDEKLDILNSARVQSLYQDSLTQFIWIGTFSNGLYRYHKRRGELEQINMPLLTSPIRTITKIDIDKVWVGVDGAGIFEFDRFDGEFIDEYSQRANGCNYTKADNIYHILDNDNSILICTYTDGVFIYNKSRLVSALYDNIKNNSQSLSNNHVNCIIEDSQKRLWMGTNKGISRYDTNSGKWKHFLQENSTRNSIILSLYEGNSGNIWAGGYASEFIYIDKNDIVHKPEISLEGKKLKGRGYAYAIYQDNRDDIWIGGIINNLIKYNTKTKETKEYPIKGISQIAPIGEDKLVIATNGGVIIFDKKNGMTSPLVSKNESDILKSNMHTLSFSPHNSNTLWIGSEGNGLIKYNLEDSTMVNYRQSSGLSSNTISSIQYDKLGRLWIGTDNGLNCLIPYEERIDVFYKQNELPSNTFNLRSSCLLDNGNIIWGTPSGAFEMNPKEYTPKGDNIHNLRIEEFALFNSPIHPLSDNSPLNKSIDKTDKIELKHNQHSFSFKFMNLGDINSSKDLYSWSLGGFDKVWSTPSESNHAVYTNIPPGNYTFRVKVINGGNTDNSQEREIKITIHRPWWNSWLGWIIYITLGLTLIFYLFKAYRNRLETVESENKIRFFVNIAHDIRTPLTLIKAPLNEIERESLSDSGRGAVELAQRNIEKLLNMVTQLLDFQKLEREAMTLQVEYTDINSLINGIVSNFEPLARNKSITLHITLLPEEQNHGYIDQRKITSIVDNLLSNSIKYTCQYGNIWIKCSIKEESLLFEITDDGIGISKGNKKKLFKRFYRADNAVNSKEIGSGIGLLITKRMTLLHKGDISFSSQEGVGTTFRVTIPLNESSYSKTEIIQKEYNQQIEKPSLIGEKEDKKRSKLLIVEDNDELRNYLAHFFSSEFNVVESSDGEIALECVNRENPDFIISDVMMPNLSGVELCRELKSNIETCHIPIILLTSLSDREDIINGLNAGADDYITKPFDLSLLNSKIANIMRNRQLFRKKYIDKSAFSDEESIVNELDKKFMAEVVKNIEENIMDETFSIDNLAVEMAMSRSVFFKKIKSLTGQSPQEFIRDIKMKRAATLLTEKKYTISEIAYLIGYPNAKYFSTAFKKYYGVSPSNYV